MRLADIATFTTIRFAWRVRVSDGDEVTDMNRYAIGLRTSDKEIDTLNVTRVSFHGEWSCTIAPRASHSMA